MRTNLIPSEPLPEEPDEGEDRSEKYKIDAKLKASFGSQCAWCNRYWTKNKFIYRIVRKDNPFIGFKAYICSNCATELED